MQTHFFRKIYLSHFILERVDVGYVWVVSWRRNRLPHIDPKFLCIIAALLPHSAGLLNRGPEGPSPLSGAGSHNDILSPTGTGTRTVTATRTELCLPRTPTDPSRLWHLVIWLFDTHLLPVGVRICTELNPSTDQGDIPISSTGCTCFLIDGSVKGQYVTTIVSSNPSRAITFIFGQIPWGKVWTLLSSQLWVK